MSNNASSSLFNTIPEPKIHVILNTISLTASALGTLISFMILVGLLLRKKTLHDVPLLLCTNNYVVVFLLGIFEFMHNLNTLQGDFGLWIIDHNILLCQIQAYIVFSFISAVYLACVLQAVFRFCRIVYPTLLWLLNPCTYLIIIPLMWMSSFALVSPLYIRHGFKLIPGEYICRITKDDTFSIAYSTIVIYGIPFNSIAFIYFQVHRYIRQQTLSTNGNFQLRYRRRQRDIFVFRRIIIIVILLGSYGMPNSVMLIMLAITGELVSSFYRVLELSFAAAVLTLSVALFYVTPQLREKFRIFPPKLRVTAIPIHEYNIRQRRFVHNRLKLATENL